MQIIISPKVERVVTVVMTETQAKDLLDKFGGNYGILTLAQSHFPADVVMHEIVDGLRKVLKS